MVQKDLVWGCWVDYRVDHAYPLKLLVEQTNVVRILPGNDIDGIVLVVSAKASFERPRAGDVEPTSPVL